MVLSGDPVAADQALAWGLVTKVVEREELVAEAQAFAARLAARPAVALRAALKAIGEGANMSPDASVRLEAALFGVTCASEDAAEGCRAFLEKRDPDFRHC
jgi:enoyl-CoA hydratase